MAPEDKKARIYMLGDFMKGRDKAIHDPFDVSRSSEKLIALTALLITFHVSGGLEHISNLL